MGDQGLATTSRLGNPDSPPNSTSLYIPHTGPRGGGINSTVAEYDMSVQGKPSIIRGAFQVIAATFLPSLNQVCIRWRSMLYSHGRDMKVNVSCYMFRALMSLDYWKNVRTGKGSCR
jgi:hypothetical protein